jgi:hypothetical protein
VQARQECVATLQNGVAPVHCEEFEAVH